MDISPDFAHQLLLAGGARPRDDICVRHGAQQMIERESARVIDGIPSRDPLSSGKADARTDENPPAASPRAPAARSLR